VLRSPHAHARIVSIDAAEARKAPGVVAVYTAAELKAQVAAASGTPATMHTVFMTYTGRSLDDDVEEDDPTDSDD